MSSGKVVLALLAGIAAGAALGVLFAPAKGSETRKSLTGKGEDLKESIKDKFNEFLDDISEKYDRASNEEAESDNSDRDEEETERKVNKAAV